MIMMLTDDGTISNEGHMLELLACEHYEKKESSDNGSVSSKGTTPGLLNREKRTGEESSEEGSQTWEKEVE